MASTVVKVGETLTATKVWIFRLASTTLLFWDMALTANQEYERVWKAKKCFGRTLFLWNRYLPPAIFILDLAAQFKWDPSTKVRCQALPLLFCKAYELTSTLLDFVVIAIVECILIIRTHALYSNTTLFYSLAFFATVLVPATNYNLVGCLSGCTQPLCKPLLIVFWIPFLLFETSIFLLTVWKSYSTFMATQLRGDNYGKRLIEALLFRDGMIYYLATSLMNFFIWIFDPFASYLAVGILKCLQATICSRLLLNIRGMLEPQYMQSISVVTRTADVSLATVDRHRQSTWTKSFADFETVHLQSLEWKPDEIREEPRYRDG
ncbi:hypothetical protein FA13DRAFT_1735324 [Coprinellus micaceus]|uniref:DUF6533 domain-containing protein n=1 Tax=Coprinellus micaceus TaxID=71717 RepID=A0A4Y7T4D4_COPMI|nr:hypothetical protein FA13DRAFT_1735324 [Coprinellus micaceus]